MGLILTWLLIVLMATAANAETPLFTQGETHRSNSDYRQYFETVSARIGQCTLSIAQKAYEPDLALQIYEQIEADEAALAALAQPQPHTVYVVEKLISGMQRVDDALYCTAEQVLDGSYRAWLTETAFQTDRWRGIGLAAYVFGANVDEAALAAWYASGEHDDMLSLFHGYFVPAFASDEEICMAEQTSAALTAYIIGQEGTQAALTAAPEDYTQGWLMALGVHQAYVDPYAGLLDGYTYYHNQYYAMIATSPKGDVFKMNPIAYDMSTPALARRTLCELEKAVEAILSGVERDAPNYYPVLAKHYEAPVTYEFGEGGHSVCYVDSRRITLISAASIIHETSHMITPSKVERRSRYMEVWKVEAIAEYLTLTYYPGRSELERAMESIQEDTILALADEEERAWWQGTRDVYLLHAPMPEKPEDVNIKLWWRAQVAAANELEQELNTVSDSYANAGSATVDEVNGNELTYVEGEWLASYLINRHGLSAFLHYCMDEGVTMEDAFGMPYEDAKADWLAHRSILD